MWAGAGRFGEFLKDDVKLLVCSLSVCARSGNMWRDLTWGKRLTLAQR